MLSYQNLSQYSVERIKRSAVYQALPRSYKKSKLSKDEICRVLEKMVQDPLKKDRLVIPDLDLGTKEESKSDSKSKVPRPIILPVDFVACPSMAPMEYDHPEPKTKSERVVSFNPVVDVFSPTPVMSPIGYLPDLGNPVRLRLQYSDSEIPTLPVASPYAK